MRKVVGEYNEALEKLYGSLRKRFNLNYEETLDEVDDILGNDELVDYSVILVSSDDTHSNEFISEVNANSDAKAFGFYKSGIFAYENVQEVREMVPTLLERNERSFVFISVEFRSHFKILLPNTVTIKLGREDGKLRVEIIKTRPIIENEIIKKPGRDDFKDFRDFIDRLYLNRWEKRPDIFQKHYSITPTAFLNMCNSHDSKNIIVCIKDEKMVGFVIYDIEKCQKNGFVDSSMLSIEDIYVDVEYRRQGIATRMYEAVERVACKLKFSKIRFNIWEDDEEMKLFISSLHSKALSTLYEVDI